MKILITGGHFTPALSLISSLKKNNGDDLSILFVGRKYSLDSEKTYSLEYQEVMERKIRFIPLEAGRLTRMVSVRTLKSILKIPLGFAQAFSIMRNERPDLVFTFGGYLALPVVIWAYIFSIPIYTHEQTIHPGISNRIIGLLAKKVFVSFGEVIGLFNRNKVIVTGNPVRPSVFEIKKKPFKIGKDKPVLYITGGSLGSHSINEHVFYLLTRLLEKYTVIHQLGDTKEYNDFDTALRYKQELPVSLRGRYYPVKHFFEEEIGYIYSVSDLVIGRAGANTFFELLALQKPALFIPLPWSAGNEQEKHALIFKDNGAGEIFNQADTSEQLMKVIDSMILNLDKYSKNFKTLQHLFKKDAADFICKEIIPAH